MEGSGLVALPLIAWLASGLAAVALAPRNRSAQALAAGGLLWVVSWQLEGASASTPLHAAFVDVAFLGGLTCVVALLATYPAGEFSLRWQRFVVLGLAVVSVLAPLARLAGQHEVREVGRVLVASEPLWIPLGVVLLVLRWRRGTPTAPELRPVLLGIVVLAVVLVIAVTSSMSGRPLPDAVMQPLFLGALALLPVVLLAGITRRIRRLDKELAASRARLVEAEDEVRRAIERDLHDGVQQQLVALLPLIQLADRQARRDPDVAARTLGDMREQVTGAITDLRELVYGIRPPVLEDKGIAAALESRLAKLPVEVTLDSSSANARRWPPETEAAAYFVACEAVTNAIKHAPGSSVAVRLADRGEELVVEVSDDGPGLPRAARGGTTGRGLAGLRDRVDSLGGAFDVLARDGGGTVVRARFVREGTP